MAFPGLTRNAAELLVERRAASLGIDTLSTDPGAFDRLPGTPHDAARRVLAATAASRLERVSEPGAWLVVAPLLLVDGSGTPARVFAILPPDATRPPS